MLRSAAPLLQALAASLDQRAPWRRFLLGLALIITLLFGAHVASTAILAATSGDAVVINESGRQRMLSQRIMFYATARAKTDDPNAEAILLEAVSTFETAHRRLSTLPALSDKSRALYFRPIDAQTPSLDDLVRRFVEDATLVASEATPAHEQAQALARITAVGPQILLSRLNDVVKQFEIEAQKRARDLLFLQVFLMLVALTIVIKALFMFAAQVAARRDVTRLEEQAADLEAARVAEAAKNSALAAQKDAAEREALHDPLTGLANRRYLEREMARRAQTSEDPARSVAVLHIDLDRFKQINDTLGHAAGDYILRHVAAILTDAGAPDDFVARVGGDEFVVLRSSAGGRDTLEALAARIIDRLSRPVEFEGEYCHFGASVGIDVGIAAAAGPNIDPHRLLSNADIALYRSKEVGRGCFTFFCEELRDEIETSRRLADDLAGAVARREFFAVYQPQICARTGALHGVEALARWRHPSLGELSPARFIDVAERLGLMAAIDEQILEMALTDLATWDALGLSTPRLAVNVSARRLRDPLLIESLARLEPPRGRLSFEIVETIFAERVDQQMGENLSRLRALGVELEIDDFGTGHASLASIIALQPNRLKIARELIAPLPDSALHRNLAQTMMGVSRTLEMPVIAEGVETEAQAALLADLGCDVLQGYYFAKPMTADALIARGSCGGLWTPEAVLESAAAAAARLTPPAKQT
ncbi:MAG: EAL domain-containing protein [Pseudomonadota bacterium]